MTSVLTMTLIEEAWRRAEVRGPGGATRVDERHPVDLYGATDPDGRPGILLLSQSEPPSRPSLDAIDVTAAQRHDGRWAVGIWLDEPSLLPMFVQLCTDLIESSRDIRPTAAAGFLLVRLLRWRELLERGAGPMPMSKLRGLIGELLVLEKSLDLWPSDDVVSGWVGPLGGPQDFVVPGRRIEVKTTFPSARSVRITSIDQLDTEDPLTLAVVSLTAITGSDGLAPASLVERLGAQISTDGAEVTQVFHRRLDAAGYRADPLYARPMFRVDGVDYYDVAAGFPRIRRSAVGLGVDRVVYDVLLGACAPFKTSLRR